MNSREERLEEVERELAEVQEKAERLRARWQTERGAIGKIAELKERWRRCAFRPRRRRARAICSARRSCSMARFRRLEAELRR
jgi:ATP-dependent Clp protease ATP-binding subunit ClpB